MRNLRIGIVGATGLVGQTILKVLDEEDLFNGFDITLFVSSRSAGKEYLFNGRRFRFIELNEKALKQNFDIMFFSAGSEVSKVWVEKFANLGTYVIDNTNAFRMREDVPLVVPEINLNRINLNSKIISNPNCSTIELTIVINKLRILSKIKKVVVSTYQAVSGAGRRALLDLKNNAKNVFKYGINNEIIAKIGEICKNGYSEEENKIMNELPKILECDIDVSATAVRVPTENCHGESVYVKFEKAVSMIDVLSVIDCEYIKFEMDNLFYLKDCSGTNLTYVCRLRQKSETEIEFFVVADNLRRGAAFNAVQIAKVLIEKIIKDN